MFLHLKVQCLKSFGNLQISSTVGWTRTNFGGRKKKTRDNLNCHRPSFFYMSSSVICHLSSIIHHLSYVNGHHCCLVVHINVIQKQNIFFSWMNRPSDHSSRRIIPVQFLELLHKYRYFFFWNKKFKIYIFFFTIFFEFLKTLLLDLTCTCGDLQFVALLAYSNLSENKFSSICAF